MQQDNFTFKGLPGLWSQFKASLSNLGRTSLKTRSGKRAWKYLGGNPLPGVCEVLGSVPRTVEGGWGRERLKMKD